MTVKVGGGGGLQPTLTPSFYTHDLYYITVEVGYYKSGSYFTRVSLGINTTLDLKKVCIEATYITIEFIF